MHPKELIKGTLRPVILRLLDREGRMYGYQMSKRVEALSEGDYQLTEGALYPTLQKLVKDGLVVKEIEKVNGRARHYYRITPAGQAATADSREEFRLFVRTMQRLLDLQF